MSVIGLRVGPFEIVEPALVPEPGAWYRARRTGMTRRQPVEVLVKLLPPDAEGPERYGLQTMFDRLRAVEDPRVPVAVDVYEGIGALALDAPDGVCFTDIVTAREAGAIDLSPPTLLDIALELAECLQHAHHRNRLHGHLGAHNIRLSTSGQLHIFGFGNGPTTDCDPAWQAPERRAGEPSTAATDQWSLAAVLVGLIAGTPPIEDPHAHVEPLERQWPALARLFLRMLARDPANRFPTMHPVRQELIALSRRAGGSSDRVELGKRMARRIARPIIPDAAAPVLPTTPPAELDEDPPTNPTVLHVPDAKPEPAPPMPVPQPPEPPPVAPRKPASNDPVRPLIDEAINIVHPEISPEDVPLARRQGQPRNLLSSLIPDAIPSDPDEDTSDHPTVRYHPSMLSEFDAPPPEAVLATPPAQAQPEAMAGSDFETGEIMLDAEAVTHALVVSDHGVPHPTSPTAVPTTDADSDFGEQTDFTDATLAELHGTTGGTDIDLPLLESPDGSREGRSIQFFAPWLVLGMVLLMVAAIMFAVM